MVVMVRVSLIPARVMMASTITILSVIPVVAVGAVALVGSGARAGGVASVRRVASMVMAVAVVMMATVAVLVGVAAARSHGAGLAEVLAWSCGAGSIAFGKFDYDLSKLELVIECSLPAIDLTSIHGSDGHLGMFPPSKSDKRESAGASTIEFELSEERKNEKK